MLVLDANILIRGVLGLRVYSLISKYAKIVEFITPETAFNEAREKLLDILARRRIPAAPAMLTLDVLSRSVRILKSEDYAHFEAIAPERLRRRFSRQPLPWSAPSGPRTTTSSAAA